jgi:acid phosphatase (class A)
MPATWALLNTVQNDADLTGNLAKLHFARIRPWGIDPSLPNCDSAKGKKALGSYPSGHAVVGYSVGWALAQLMPDKAPAILARAQDYALSRLICGVHFASDTEASHVIGSVVAARLFADPRLAARIAAARAEIDRR